MQAEEQQVAQAMATCFPNEGDGDIVAEAPRVQQFPFAPVSIIRRAAAPPITTTETSVKAFGK